MSVKKLIIKQSIKYFLIIVVALASFFLARIMWNLPPSIHYWGLGVTLIIIIIAFIFDALTLGDAIPLLKN